MANYTENFRLKKPEPEDFYDIEDFNGNMDILDSKVKSLDDSNTILKESMEILKSDVGTTKDTGGTTTAG
ncbi:MAG: phage tail protein, partial [Tyzzerella sp.]|nr:phage tail protein [Candidatus Fimicola merdigallinarum]MBO8435139.1 phage tail protein [Candidatus Fimicola merdigallinarum]